MLCAYSFTSRYIKAKNRASSRLLAQNRVSQVFWEPIKNRATPRSALLKAVYLEALLYLEGKAYLLRAIIVFLDYTKQIYGMICIKKQYSKPSRYTASRSADLGDARFLIGSQNTWDTRILVKSLEVTWFLIFC